MVDTTAGTNRGADNRAKQLSLILFLIVLGLGVIYVAIQLTSALEPVHEASILPFILLGVALAIALGFEFVNGFHDTANAVATVIYTHSLQPNIAVVWSGAFNFLGVLTSTGAVAFGIVSLLPVELILQVGSSAGFAMVFALLIAAIIWNLGTWALGLPSSSSHTLIGSIIGVGLMNQLTAGPSGTSGVDWGQALTIGESLLLSPLVGFVGSAVLLLGMKALIKIPKLYTAPKGKAPPPFWIRALLVLTCTGVSFAHGSNDGQKGMGLIMLILIGTVPTAFALNRAVTADETQVFVAVAHQAAGTLHKVAGENATPSEDPRKDVTDFVRTHTLQPTTLSALESLTTKIADEVGGYGQLSAVPQEKVNNVRNEIYLTDEALRLMQKTGVVTFTGQDADVIKTYRKELDSATKFIPTWVKVAVALALGLGTMVGWKRIVVTVGEKIGKDHLTYGQGASAELVAMATIGAADSFGLPVSTTHVLSSGVAGTMAANGSGLQWGTVRSLILAWVLTLPVSIGLSAGLFFVFKNLF
jgi:PiT family inorganic phosphate transporter